MSSSKLPSVSAPTGIAEKLQEAVRKGVLILQVNTTLHTRAHAHRHRNAPPYSLHQPAAYPCIMRGHWSSKAPPFHPPTRMGTKPPFLYSFSLTSFRSSFHHSQSLLSHPFFKPTKHFFSHVHLSILPIPVPSHYLSSLHCHSLPLLSYPSRYPSNPFHVYHIFSLFVPLTLCLHSFPSFTNPSPHPLLSLISSYPLDLSHYPSPIFSLHTTCIYILIPFHHLIVKPINPFLLLPPLLISHPFFCHLIPGSCGLCMHGCPKVSPKLSIKVHFLSYLSPT